MNAISSKKYFQGIVESVSMNKTIVVRCDRVKMHPLLKKRFIMSKHFHVHDEKNDAKVGDTVQFVECRPLSKTKRWRLIKKVTKPL